MVDSLNGGMVSFRQDEQDEDDLFLFLSHFHEEREKKQSAYGGGAKCKEQSEYSRKGDVHKKLRKSINQLIIYLSENL